MNLAVSDQSGRDTWERPLAAQVSYLIAAAANRQLPGGELTSDLQRGIVPLVRSLDDAAQAF